MLFSFINSNINTSWLLCFNMPLSPRGTAKPFTKASNEENFATSQAIWGNAHITRPDLQTPIVIALRREQSKRGLSSTVALRDMEVGLLHPCHRQPSITTAG